MNDNRTIRIMVFEPGRAPYTTMLEDSLEHRQELVGGDIECIPLWRYPGRTGRFFDR